MNQRELAAAMSDRRPAQGRLDGPLVSIVVVTRNGAHHLRRLFAGLRDNTRYRKFEVIVVDNGSDDDSGAVFGEKWGFSLSLIRNDTNSTFSIANNQGIEAATGELILFLNNDVDPINPSWLGCMVDALVETPHTVAVGALLVYPERTFPAGTEPAHPDLSIQHAGMYFEWRNGQLRAGNVGTGTDPLAPAATAVQRHPGVTAACLLATKAHVEAVGGFTEGYIYGSEDWDLCLQLSRFGDIRCTGAAALFHHEYGTQQEIKASITEVNRRDNRQRFVETWGPRLTRELRLDRLRQEGFWTPDRKPRALIIHDPKQRTFGSERVLTAMLEDRGWEMTVRKSTEPGELQTNQDLDILITTTPEIDLGAFSYHTFKVAWVTSNIEEWESAAILDEYRLVAVSNPVHARRIEAITGLEPILLAPVAATDEHGSPDPVYEADIIVEGGAKQSRAQLPKMLSFAPGERVVVIGKGWEQEPRFMRYWRGVLEDDQTAALRANAKIVVHSQRPGESWWRSGGVLSTLQAGALPVTDSYELSQWMFDGRLPVATTSQQFRSIVERYGSSADARDALVGELLSIVDQRHTKLRRTKEFESAIADIVSRPVVAIKTSPHNREVAEKWGDTHFARQFGKALRRLGYYSVTDILPQWDMPSHQEADVVVHLRGLDPYVPKPGSFNVLWIVSHPADITPEECNRFDLVLVASHMFAERLATQVEVPVYPLLQATDTGVFHPGEPDPELRSEILFVGNARYPARIAPRWTMESDLPLTIYGANWDNFPENQLVADQYFPNDELARLYRSADIVLNDHWPDMKQEGFLSNRLFDVLASGGFLISDHVDGIDDVFDGAIPTYRTKSDLAEVVGHFRANPSERSALAIRGMRAVRASHSFDARAREFVDYLTRHAGSLRLTVDGSPQKLDRSTAKNERSSPA